MITLWETPWHILKETTIIDSHGFVMELLQWHKVCGLGGDKLHRPPMVALTHSADKLCPEDHSLRIISALLVPPRSSRSERLALVLKQTNNEAN